MTSCKQKTEDSEDGPEEKPDDIVVIQHEGSEVNLCSEQQVFIFTEWHLKQ